MTVKDAATKSGNRKELFFLVVIFSAPFVAAWMIYTFTNFGNNGDTSNYGDLITPPRVISDAVLTAVATGKTGARLHGKWSLIYILPEVCSSECQDNIRMMRNLRAALGNNSDRVQAVVALENPAVSELKNKLAVNFSWTRIFMINRADLRAATENDSNLEENVPALDPGFYMVDPLGNMMMRYKSDSEGAGILGDLKRLLRLSRIG